MGSTSSLEGSSSWAPMGQQAGYTKLVQLLEENPEAIADMGCRRMHLATTGQRLAAGELPDPVLFTETRSRVTEHPSNANWAWVIANILRASFADKHMEVRARLLLALASAEQFSMDRGSWLHAWELNLLEEPPYARFAQHGQSRSKNAHSQLIDPQFFNLVQSRLKSLDEAIERKKRLEGNKPPPAAGDPPGPRLKGPKAKAKPPQTDQT